MSFASGPKSGGHGHGQQQPKQRRDQDTPIEKNIKASIQDMHRNVQEADEQIDLTRKGHLSKRTSEALEKGLEKGRQLATEIEELFREWTVQLTGEPGERHRKRFSYDKLQKAFEEEVALLKDVARRAVLAQQEALSTAAGSTSRAGLETEGSGQDCEAGLLDDSGSFPMQTTHYEDLNMTNRVAQEREEGIKRIQGQVSEVNQIFRDLASLVVEQGQHFQTIEQQSEDASTSTREAVKELKKAARNTGPVSGKVLCCCALAFVLLCWLLVPRGASSAHTSSPPQGASISAGAAPLAVAEAGSSMVVN